MKKIFFILIPIALLTILAIVAFQYVVQLQTQKGALQVTASPESKVYLNNSYIGQTPLCKCESSTMLPTGDYTIRLVPDDKSVAEFQDKITVSEGVLTVVDRKFGANNLSEGSVISLSPLEDKKAIGLAVVSFPQSANVLLDNNPIGQTPLEYDDATESDHVITVKKEGYTDKSIRIRTPAGYKLTVAVYLSTNLATAQDVSPTPLLTTSPEPTGTQDTTEGGLATPSAALTQTVTILDTPTGFLRVRKGASVDADEVGKVSPGDKLDLVDESNGWYLIKMNDGTQGWISAQYAQKASQ